MSAFAEAMHLDGIARDGKQTEKLDFLILLDDSHQHFQFACNQVARNLRLHDAHHN
jgi:hypothetical protein